MYGKITLQQNQDKNAKMPFLKSMPKIKHFI